MYNTHTVPAAVPLANLVSSPLLLICFLLAHWCSPLTCSSSTSPIHWLASPNVVSSLASSNDFYPADAPDFTPYDPFAPDTGGFPYSSPHSDPPSHHPSPTDYTPGSEEEVEDPLPFPCFRYEEELAVALLQNGAVHSVEHLLAVAPGCSMPLEVLDSFQGRFPGSFHVACHSQSPVKHLPNIQACFHV